VDIPPKDTIIILCVTRLYFIAIIHCQNLHYKHYDISLEQLFRVLFTEIVATIDDIVFFLALSEILILNKIYFKKFI